MNNKNKKLEDTIVKGYERVEDKFIFKYLTRDNETLKEAKERLKKECRERNGDL